MKVIKAVALLVALAFIPVSTCGCGISRDRKYIFDDNLELIKEGDSFSYLRRDAKIYSNRAIVSFDDFNGAETVISINTSKGEEIKLKYEAEIKRGEFKIIIVSPLYELASIAEINKSGTYSLMAEKGKYKVKIAGRNAAGEVEIELLRG